MSESAALPNAKTNATAKKAASVWTATRKQNSTVLLYQDKTKEKDQEDGKNGGINNEEGNRIYP